MSKSLRMLLAVIAVATALAVALSGCQPGTGTATTAPATSAAASASAESSTPAETASAPATVDLPEYQIDYFMLANGPYDKMSDIDAAVSKITKAKINATVKTTIASWDPDWSNKVTTRISAGDKADICFTADWLFYSRDVAANLFTPLNDLLAKDAPDTVKSLGDQFIKGSQIDGVNYGVPTEKELLVPGGMIFNKDLLDKYGFDLNTINKESDIEPWLKTIKEKEPDIIPFLTDGGDWDLPIYGVYSSFNPAVTIDGTDADSGKVFDKWESDVYKEHLNMMRKWYQAGYIHKDSALDSFKENDRLLAPGWFATFQPLKGNNAKADELGASAKMKLVERTLGPLVVHSADCGGSMLAIPTTSQDPDRAMMFINLLHQDKDVVNLFAWGIEGVNYKKVSDNIVEVIPGNGWTDKVQLWTLGSQFNQFVSSTENPEKFKLLKEYSSQGKAHYLLGFRYKSDKMTNQITAINNIVTKYQKPLDTGSIDPATELPKFVSEMKAAGLDDVIADMQSQIDAFVANNKK